MTVTPEDGGGKDPVSVKRVDAVLVRAEQAASLGKAGSAAYWLRRFHAYRAAGTCLPAEFHARAVATGARVLFLYRREIRQR